MEARTESTCRNCGAAAPSRYCPECGQSTTTAVPSLTGLLHEAGAAVISYDSRLWRTLRVLMRQPGELTLAYLGGIRARYLSPFQLFFWLQAATFIVNRTMFDRDQAVSDAKSRDLLLVGVAVAVMLSLLHASRKRKFIENLVCATHLWSFLMVVLLAEYLTLPLIGQLLAILAPHATFYIGYTATIVAILVMVVYAPITFVKVYKDKWWVAVLETALMVGLYYELAVLLARYLHPGIRA